MTIIEQTWAVSLVAAMSLLALYELHFFIALLCRKPWPSTRVSVFVHTAFWAGAAACVYAFCFEPFWLEVRRMDITTRKLQRAEFTVVQISDLHCDERQGNEEEVVRRVNALDADIIVFTGDSINSPSALPVFKNMLGRLKARLGKVAVKGNWDVWYWKDLDIFQGTGFRALGGGMEIFSKDGEKVSVSGLDVDQQAGLSAISRVIRPEMYNIFLYHYPGINEEIGDTFFDLILSGHIHGGQVALPFYGAVVTLSPYGKKYESGAYRLPGGKLMYVSRGIGMEGYSAPRMRFLSRPEITVFHIKPGAQ